MDFLSLTEKGKNNRWRYLLSILVILFIGVILGRRIVSALLPYIIEQGGSSPYLLFIVSHLSVLLLFASVWFAVRIIQKRSFMTVITTRNKVSWQRYFYGFAVTFLVYAVWNLADYFLFHLNTYHYFLPEWGIQPFLIMAFLCLLIVPFQAGMEEILFRGYMLQVLGRKIKNGYVLSLVSSLLFVLVHIDKLKMNLSAPMIVSLLSTFLFAFFASMITLKSNGIEFSSGIHTANNLFVFIIVSKVGRVKTTPLFEVEIGNAWINLGIGVLLLVLIYYLMIRFLKIKRTNGMKSSI